MTENEARTKRCPSFRSMEVFCIASECMAWRWNEPIPNEKVAIVGTGQPVGDNWEIEHEAVIECGPRKGQGVTGWIRFFPEERTGRCGLAGQK